MRNLVDQLKVKKNLRNIWNFDLIKLEIPVLQTEPIITGSHTTAWAIFLEYQKIKLIDVDYIYIENDEGSESLQDERQLHVVQEKQNENYFFQG